MNKIMTVALLAGGLLLLDAPEAAAHKQVRNVYQPSAHYHVDHRHFEHRRPKHMPYWLKRNKAFRRWYRRSHYHQHRSIAWPRLYEIFLWERYYATNYRGSDRFYKDRGGYREYRHRGGHREYRDHDHDSDSDRRRRNRH